MMPLLVKSDDVKRDESCPTASELIVTGKKLNHQAAGLISPKG